MKRVKHADLFEVAPMAHCELDRELMVIDANLAAASLFQIDHDDLLASLIPCDAAGELSRHVAQCFDARDRVTSDVRLAIHGNDVVVHATSAPLFDHGAVVSCVTTLEDVTREKRNEVRAMTLAAVGGALAAPIGESVPLARVARLAVPALADVCFVDLCGEGPRDVHRNTVVTERHALVDRLFAQSKDAHWNVCREELLTTCKPIFEPVSATALGTELATEIGAKGLMLLPLVARDRAMGLLGLLTLDWSYTRDDFDAASQLASRLAIAMDNARRFETTQRRIRARDEMLATVCHDLRQPLGVIVGFASLAAKHASGEIGQTFQAIQRAAWRMNRMLCDLLDISSIENARLAVVCRPTNLVVLVRDVALAFTPTAGAKNIALQITSGGDSLIALADADRVTQVLSNLLDNAIKFSRPGSDVRIAVETRGNAIRIAVKDSGPGIPAEHLDRVFDRYWQADDSARMGHGLGLAIAKGIITASHGEIGVESTVGVGTTFFFTLPKTD